MGFPRYERKRVRTVNIEPPKLGRTDDGLAWALFTPPEPPLGAILVLHGAGSAKESHYDFCRNARAAGMAALAFDNRGHGESEGAMGASIVKDLRTMAVLLPAGVPLAMRGSSMGGYLAIAGAEALGARALVAICPAPASGLRRGLAAGRFPCAADVPAFDAFLSEHDDLDAARGLDCPLLLLHAEGDEIVPVAHSRELAETAPDVRLIAVPGGHHRSIQHDGELQGESLRWLAARLR